ncbi:hypothetical protein F5B18DRAFT_543171 [Nemania serpens]|nr:hypothetical protein F5B18DRAFT_543171 [Nemania serpens]
MMRKLVRELYTTPYKDRKDINPVRVPGTCEWFTSHELFKHWRENIAQAYYGCLQILAVESQSLPGTWWMMCVHQQQQALRVTSSKTTSKIRGQWKTHSAACSAKYLTSEKTCFQTICGGNSKLTGLRRLILSRTFGICL